MRNKIKKVLKTVWRLPEISTDYKTWSMRIVAFVIPLVALGASFLFLSYNITILAAIIITLIILIVLVIVYIRLFSEEEETLDYIEEQENKVRDYFQKYPEITDIPLRECWKNRWTAYGHVDPGSFILAVNKVIAETTQDHQEADSYLPLVPEVEHLYAQFKDENDLDGPLIYREYIFDGAFPVTRIDKDIINERNRRATEDH